MANLLVPLDQKSPQKIKEEAKDQDATEERTPVGHHSDVVQEFKTEPRTPEPSALLDSKMANSSLAQDTKSIPYHLPEKPTFFASSGIVKGVNASISSSTETETVVETTPMLRGSPKRISHDWPIPSKDANLPALLLRMGPAVTGWDTAPTRLPSSLSSASSRSHLPSRPSVDSWVAPDVSLGAMPSARLQRDSYIAPRSPSPPRSGRAGSQARRNEHSPVRIRHREGRGEDRSDSGWGEDVSRKRMQAVSWREEHLPPKRRRSDVDGFGDEPRARPYDDREPRRDVGSRSNEEFGTPYHESADRRHQHHRRESSLDRRSHREGRAASEERRGTRYVDHQDDRRSRGGVEGRRDTRNGDSGTSGSDVRDTRARYVNGGEEMRVLISDRSPRGSERRSFADEQYGKQSDNTDRGTGRRLQSKHDSPCDHPSLTLTSSRSVRDYSTQVDKADDRDYRRPYTDDRSREPVTNSKERERSPRKEHADSRRSYAEDRPKETIVSTQTERESSPRKEYEGGRAQSTTSHRNGVTSVDNASRSYVAVNGNDQHAESKPKILPPTGPTAQINAARAVPYPRPGAINNARNQGHIPQALSFRRGGSMSSTRSATTGSNTEPITARRGFEIPQASASPVIAQTPIKTPKDTLSPPLQDQDYIINSFAELKNMVKPLWIENPKQPMANFLTGGKGGANGLGPRGPAYRIQTGRLGGRNITRYAAWHGRNGQLLISPHDPPSELYCRSSDTRQFVD